VNIAVGIGLGLLEGLHAAHEAKSESGRETEARIKAAVDEIDSRVEAARQRIRDAAAAARAELEAVAADAAQQMVEQLTGIKVESQDAAKAVEAELQVMTTIER